MCHRRAASDIGADWQLIAVPTTADGIEIGVESATREFLSGPYVSIEAEGTTSQLILRPSSPSTSSSPPVPLDIHTRASQEPVSNRPPKKSTKGNGRQKLARKARTYHYETAFGTYLASKVPTQGVSDAMGVGVGFDEWISWNVGNIKGTAGDVNNILPPTIKETPTDMAIDEEVDNDSHYTWRLSSSRSCLQADCRLTSSRMQTAGHRENLVKLPGSFPEDDEQPDA
jgi:hypothetical protein